MNRKLDGCYFRVKRGDKYESICFSDLTTEERERMCERREAEWFKSLCFHLADCLKQIGDQFNIVYGESDDERTD